MSFNLPLTEDDRNFLVDTKENTTSLNSQINENTVTCSTEVAKLLLIDLPFKKKLDPYHVDIFEYEEELRYLNGTSIVQPLQERGITVYNNSLKSSRIFLNDGRLIITQEDQTILNAPLIPMRGYSKSKPAGTSFDIWSRDRFGSTTSIKLAQTSFTINDSHKNFRVLFDNYIDVEVDLSQVISIIQENEVLVSVTTGEEVEVTFSLIPVTANTEVIKINSNESSINLIRNTDYSVDYESGKVTLLKKVLSGRKIIVYYKNQGSFAQNEEVLSEKTSGEETELFITSSIMIPESETLSLVTSASSEVLERNIDYTINYSTGVVEFLKKLPTDNELTASYHNEVTLEASSLASSLQTTMQNAHSLLANVACMFNPNINTFTIVSGTAGPTSSAEVIDASEFDIKEMLGFNEQYKIQGKFQNNLLNVEIDGVATEIKIADFRFCFEDNNISGKDRGFNNDDLGFDWSGSYETPLGYEGYNRVGPMFCYVDGNGKDVARSIEAQLRMVGSGGFKDVNVHYFTDSQKFVIFSGTTGVDSSVHVLPASDPDRDARSFIGYTDIQPEQEIGHEEFFITLGDLFNKLNSLTNSYGILPVMLPAVANRLSHSILYTQPTGVNINTDFQTYDLTTSSIYDYGSRGLPRLYLNGKATIDSTNNLICYMLKSDTDVEYVVKIEQGTYSESELADAIAKALGSEFTCTYSQRKSFVIDNGSKEFCLLWKSGNNTINTIGNYIGFDVTEDSGYSTQHVSQPVTFQMSNYFYPSFPNQFEGVPKVNDFSIDEQSALYKEEEYLKYETSQVLPKLLDRLQNNTVFDNEATLECWEQLTSLEIAKVGQQYEAIRRHRGAYANHISESQTDANIIRKNVAYDNLKPNYFNLTDCRTRHGYVMNINTNTEVFIAGTQFSDGGEQMLEISVLEDDGGKIYNKPAPYVRYSSNTKQIPGTFETPTLMTHSNKFIPYKTPSFFISANSETKGYSCSESNTTGYSLKTSENTSATILASNSGPFNLNSEDNIIFKIDDSIIRTVSITATHGYTESRVSIVNNFVIEAGINDKIDFSENASTQLTATIPRGVYTGAQLAAQIQNSLNNIGSSDYIVNYNSIALNRFAFFSSGTGGSGVFRLLFETGSNSDKSVAFILGFNKIDKSGVLSYVSDTTVILPIQSNVNDEFFIEIDGEESHNPIIINQDYYDSNNILVEISNAIVNYTQFEASQFLVEKLSNKIRISSKSLGSNSTISVFEGTHDFLRTIALDNDAPVQGGSNVYDIHSVTVDEIVEIINNQLPEVIASNDQEKVRISTVSKEGSVSSINIVGGTCYSTIGFNLGTFYGLDRDNLLKVNIDGNESVNPICLNTDYSNISGIEVADDIQVQLRSKGIGTAYSLAECYFNEKTIFQNFENKLRILSGNKGISSSVNVSDKTIKIITGVNDQIVFQEAYEVYSLATISAGFYNPLSLVTEIKNKLEQSGSNSYDVYYSTSSKKVTITSSGSYFSLIFDQPNSICSVLGFFPRKYLGSLSYSSSGFLKWCSCHEELGFSMQISEPGHILNSVKLYRDSESLYTLISWLDHGGGQRKDIDINLSDPSVENIRDLIEKIKNNYLYITNNSYAFLLGTVSSEFRIEDQDVLSITVDSTPIQHFTFEAKKATINSDTDPATRFYEGVDDEFKIYINGFQVMVKIGTQLTPEDVANKIQNEVRTAYCSTDKNVQAALSLFECTYNVNILNMGFYTLTSGTGGTSSRIQVSNEVAAQHLKIQNKSSNGSGNVYNSCYVTCQEVINRLSSLTGATVSVEPSLLLPSYLKIRSNSCTEQSRIRVEGTMAEKIGFNSFNNVSFPYEEQLTTRSLSLCAIEGEEIRTPLAYNLKTSWDSSKGNVEITYFSIDNTKIIERKNIINDRNNFIPLRKPQIVERTDSILGMLTPELYDQRKSKVNMRLNKKTGSYIKVGEKFAQQENNNSTVDTNTTLINDINDILA